jgi:hypothetical protein
MKYLEVKGHNDVIYSQVVEKNCVCMFVCV